MNKKQMNSIKLYQAYIMCIGVALIIITLNNGVIDIFIGIILSLLGFGFEKWSREVLHENDDEICE